MNVQTLAAALKLKILAAGNIDREVSCGYTCDLLSWVMAHGQPGMVWITVQTHLNVVAVASLLDMAAVIIPENITVDAATLAKAEEEGVAVLSSPLCAYDLVAGMIQAGIDGVGK